MPKTYKNIPVAPPVYEQVAEIAGSNGRTMGGQVMIWARECPHHPAQRVLLGSTIVAYPPDGKVTAQVEIWQCRECGRLLVLPAEGFDADLRTVSAAVAAETGA